MSNEESTKDTIKDMRCVICKAITHHNLKYSSTAYYPDEEYDPVTSEEGPSYYDISIYRVWSCAGCDMVRLEIASRSMGFGPDEEGESSVYYPEYSASRINAKHFWEINDGLQMIYNEVIKSFNTGLRLTCAMGIRALLEAICVDKGVDDGITRSLEEKLHILCERKYIPPTLINALLSLKIMGDTAAHKLDAPQEMELRMAIDLIEQIIDFIYELEERITNQARTASLFKRDEVTKLLEKRENKRKKVDTKVIQTKASEQAG